MMSEDILFKRTRIDCGQIRVAHDSTPEAKTMQLFYLLQKYDTAEL